MKKALVVLSIAALMATVATAAPVRVDYNGELVSPNNSGINTDPAMRPYGWDYYTEGAGGGIGSVWSDSTGWALQWEDEAPLYPHPTYGIGHSVIFGGAPGAGKHGLQQTISTTVGKHYMFLGTYALSGTGQANFQFGLGEGAGNHSGGFSSPSDIRQTTVGKSMAFHGKIATTNQMTAYMGLENLGSHGYNDFVDGVRVYESDVNVYSAINNGNLSSWRNLSQWDGFQASSTVNNVWMPDGWLPVGKHAGNVSKLQRGLDQTGWGDALILDGYKAQGRMYFFQRIDDGLGDHDWTMTAEVKSWHLTHAGARIGIDPTGGTDPNSSNIVWSDLNTATQTWETLSVSANGVGGNGITMWFASGDDVFINNTTSLASFANFTLVPEPTTVLFLALGGLFCLRRR